MKRFMMFSIGCLCIAVSVLIGFHIGSQRVEAQERYEILGYNCVVASPDQLMHYVILANGDTFARYASEFQPEFQGNGPKYVGNIFKGTIQAEESTWGSIKEMKK